jgi:hypothetical protein
MYKWNSGIKRLFLYSVIRIGYIFYSSSYLAFEILFGVILFVVFAIKICEREPLAFAIPVSLSLSLCSLVR